MREPFTVMEVRSWTCWSCQRERAPGTPQLIYLSPEGSVATCEECELEACHTIADTRFVRGEL